MSQLSPESQNKNLANKVLERIDQEHVAPRPRWQFATRNIAFWVLWVFSILLGAGAVAATIFVIANAGWEYSPATHEFFPGFVFGSLPYLWISVLAVMIILGYENFRHTKWGYRTPLIGIVGISVVGSLLAGLLLYQFGIGQAVDEQIGGRLPFHHSVMSKQRITWMSPDRGLLAGEVMSVTQDASAMSLRGYDGKMWNVSLDLLTPPEREILLRFKDVRVIGRFVETRNASGEKEMQFQACLVLPWEIHGRAMFLPGPERPVPFQVALPSVDETILMERRSTECEGVRPYQVMKLRKNDSGVKMRAIPINPNPTPIYE